MMYLLHKGHKGHKGTHYQINWSEFVALLIQKWREKGWGVILSMIFHSTFLICLRSNRHIFFFLTFKLSFKLSCMALMPGIAVGWLESIANNLFVFSLGIIKVSLYVTLLHNPHWLAGRTQICHSREILWPLLAVWWMSSLHSSCHNDNNGSLTLHCVLVPLGPVMLLNFNVI